jgi:hypothetical protein
MGTRDVRYEQVRVDKRVRARRPARAGVRGVVGSVLRCYGEPEYLAVEVIANDGRSRVFWYHEVDEVEAREKSAWSLAQTAEEVLGAKPGERPFHALQ